MSGVTRDLGVDELWKASLARSLARRRARQLRFGPARSRARRISLGTLVALTAGPTAGLAEGTETGAPARGTTGDQATIEHQMSRATGPAFGAKGRSVLKAKARAKARSSRIAAEATKSRLAPVELLQQALHVAVDGEFGPVTEGAVGHFQEQQGLEVDGEVGPETWAALGIHGQPELKPPAWALTRHSTAAGVRHSTPAGGSPVSATGGSRSSSARVAARTDAGSGAASAFVQCVTMHESSMNWHITDPPYSGGDQWTASMWLAAGGGRFAPTAAQATPGQQTRVFEEFEPTHPGDWPVTVRACS